LARRGGEIVGEIADRDRANVSRTPRKSDMRSPGMAPPRGRFTANGFRNVPCLRRRKSRWGPVESPVEPTVPMTSPCRTSARRRIPFLIRARCP
jgi:hypothetical protein